MKPNLFIVGAPKCGTTSMHEYLGQHPDISFPGRKEPKFFGNDLHITDRRSQSEYMELFETISNAKYTGEGMVYKLFSRSAAKEISDLFPDSKIIIMLRNPVDFMSSLYYQNRYEAIEACDTFDKALDNESYVKENFAQFKDKINMPHRLLYRENARFLEQVERYYSCFGKKNVLVLSFKDFVRDTGKTYQQTLQFLGLPPFKADFAKANAAKQNRSLLLGRILRSPPPILRKISAVFLTETIKHKLHRKAKAFNTVPIQKVPVSEATRAQLEQEYSLELRELEKRTGVSL